MIVVATSYCLQNRQNTRVYPAIDATNRPPKSQQASHLSTHTLKRFERLQQPLAGWSLHELLNFAFNLLLGDLPVRLRTPQHFYPLLAQGSDLEAGVFFAADLDPAGIDQDLEVSRDGGLIQRRFHRDFSEGRRSKPLERAQKRELRDF